MQRFFVLPTQVKEGKVHITGNDVNHIKQVLRMKIGEQLEVCDSSGKIYLCVIKSYDLKEVVLQIEKEWKNDTELLSKIYLFQGLPKGDKMEFIIQKAVELGVYEIIPMKTSRAVVKLDVKKAEKKAMRWNGISESAAKQSGRGLIPRVKEVMPMKEALAYAKALDILLIPYELAADMAESKAIIKKMQVGRSIGIFIGPEGGFEQEEVALAVSYGARMITLGKRILRTETAAMAMLAILMYEME
ncbi:MAG: 16S rRNA (uracil(1498)-N(3))-methyltransferase [Lachnospiraceae bacterium]|nr:16S rRNA (uracil(1498)-N(3))-methyltransferase [Lachnospiraceae bacterium]